MGPVVTHADPHVDGARSRRSRVLLLAAPDLLRVGLAALVTDSPDLELAGSGDVLDVALRRLDDDPPDVVVVARIDGVGGPELCASVRDRRPDAAVAIAGQPGDGDRGDLVERARRAGADALLLPCATGDEVVAALEALGRGRPPRSWVVGCPGSPVHWEDDRWREARLTPQEQRVMALLTESLTNRQIADELHLGEATVKNYVRSVLTKLGFERRTQAVVYGVHLRARGWEPDVHPSAPAP